MPTPLKKKSSQELAESLIALKYLQIVKEVGNNAAIT